MYEIGLQIFSNAYYLSFNNLTFVSNSFNNNNIFNIDNNNFKSLSSIRVYVVYFSFEVYPEIL